MANDKQPHNLSVFDNGGDHDTYWMQLLNDYFHNVAEREENDADFTRRRAELIHLVSEQIESRQVSLCRYFEEIYNKILEDGGGMSEDVMARLDEAYLSLLSGTSRKR